VGGHRPAAADARRRLRRAGRGRRRDREGRQGTACGGRPRGRRGRRHCRRCGCCDEGPGPGAGAGAAAAKAAPKKAEVHVEGGQVDQETYDQLIAEGKSERIARSKAKAAWVRKEKARLAAEGGAEEPADEAAEADATDLTAAGGDAEVAAPEAAAAPDAAAPATTKLADVHVEGAGEIDQETYDQLIAEGKGERIARAKAKAAWVRKQKQRMLEEGGA
jgi:hypothetical protein